MSSSLLLLGCGSAPDDVGSTSAESSHQSETEHDAVDVPEEHLAGAEVYAQKCGLCHDHGEAGSPRIAVPVKWTKRVAKGEDVLIKNAFEGFEGQWGEMPPQGDDLSQEQVASAVRYMIFRHEVASAAK